MHVHSIQVYKLLLPPGCKDFYMYIKNKSLVNNVDDLYLRADQRFVDTYFSSYPGYYDTMDAGIKDEEGYIKVSYKIPN